MIDKNNRLHKLFKITLAVILVAGLVLIPGVSVDKSQALPPGQLVNTITVTAIPPISPVTDIPPGSYIVGNGCPDPPGPPFAQFGCTLREAVDEANIAGMGLMGGAYILVNFFGPSAGPIMLYYGPIVVQSNVMVDGMSSPGGPIPPTPIIIGPPVPPFPLPPPANPPFFDVFQMTGNDSEITGMLVLSLGFNLDGIYVTGNKNVIDQNVILGSLGSGIHIIGGLANTISNNMIGIDAGDTCFGNSFGVIVDSGANTTAIKQNRISCNSNDGILLDSANTAVTLTMIDTNTIGLDSTDAIVKPNLGHGISLINGTINTTIGPNNIISGNTGAGISMTGATTAGNAVLQNMIGTDSSGTIPLVNGGLPIDLDDDGHTPNDTGDGDSGSNTLLNYPEVTSVTSTDFSGTVCNSCEVHIYQAFRDPAENGGGAAYLSKVTASGTGSWTASIPTGLRVTDLTLLAYDPATGDSSEFSPRPQLFLPLISK